MPPRQAGAGQPPAKGRPKERADHEVDLSQVDAFLKDGVDVLSEADADPMTALKAERPTRPAPPPPPPARAAPTPPPAKAAAAAPPPARLEVSIAKDRMEAFLVAYPREAAGLSLPQVIQALTQAGVRAGVNEDEIIALLERLPKATTPEVRVLVAEGTPLVPAQPATVTVPAIQEGPLSAEQLAALASSAERLSASLAGGQLERLAEGEYGLPLLLAGEVALRLTPAVPGSSGMDVGARELRPPPVSEALPEPGEGVAPPTPVGECAARSTGYLHLTLDRATIVPPVWISEDEMAAYALLLASPNRPLTPDLVAEAIAQAGVTQPVDPEELVRQLRRAKAGPCALLVCAGVPAEPGEDGQIELRVPVAPQAGKFLEDGSIDFKARGFGVGVEPDALLAVTRAATAGRDGITVRGRPLPATAGRPPDLQAGTGVEAVPEGETVKFYARAAGCVRFQGRSLEVVPLLAIPGDVDYATGNLDLKGNLTVEGMIRGGFEVKATGDVAVGQGLENGAVVRSGGIVAVSRGIFGAKTRVVALRAIQAQFVHDASLVCKGDVEIGNYAYHARIRAGGWVRVQGGGNRGGIAGGEICGTAGIEASSAGSESVADTRLIAGIDLEVARSLQKLEQGLEFCRANVQKLTAALRVDSADPRVVAQAAARAGPSERQRFRLLARKLEELARVAQRLESEREGLQARQQQIAQEARIRVEGTLHAGVDVFIGRAHLRTHESVKRVLLRLAADGRIERVPAP